MQKYIVNGIFFMLAKPSAYTKSTLWQIYQDDDGFASFTILKAGKSNPKVKLHQIERNAERGRFCWNKNIVGMKCKIQNRRWHHALPTFFTFSLQWRISDSKAALSIWSITGIHSGFAGPLDILEFDIQSSKTVKKRKSALCKSY